MALSFPLRFDGGRTPRPLARCLRRPYRNARRPARFRHIGHRGREGWAGSSMSLRKSRSGASRREEANESRPVRRLQCVSALNFAPVLGRSASDSDLPILSRIGPFVRLLNGWAGEEVSGCDSQGAPRLSRSGLVGEADRPRASYIAQHGAPAWIARLQTGAPEIFIPAFAARAALQPQPAMQPALAPRPSSH